MVQKKTEAALVICENVLEGIECETISTSSALLQCLRVARLMGDNDAIMWLQYEYGGYPKNEQGALLTEAWKIASENGRGFMRDGKEQVFVMLAAELESRIVSTRIALGNFSTHGASVSGEQGAIAMHSLTKAVADSTGALLAVITEDQRQLAILKSKYYDYVLRKQIELSFGNVAHDVFNAYREKVDTYLSQMPSGIILKLQAIEDKINSNNPELYSQALTTCRRLFIDVTDELFANHLQGFSGKVFKTKSGKEIDVSGNHYRNRMSAVIETLQEKAVSNSVVGSNVLYTIDWIENLCELFCKGVHAEITRQDAMQCVIHTYICLGDILNLQEGTE